MRESLGGDLGKLGAIDAWASIPEQDVAKLKECVNGVGLLSASQTMTKKLKPNETRAQLLDGTRKFYKGWSIDMPPSLEAQFSSS